MSEPDRSTGDEDSKSASTAAGSDDGAVKDDDAFEDAETDREAREEAEKLNAVPYERVKKDEGH